MRSLPRHRLRSLSTILACAVAVMVTAAPAHAAEGYANSAWDCGVGAAGGEFDEQGTTYIACGTRLQVITLAGAVSYVAIPLNSMDVAPGPDGSYVYVLSGYRPYKLNRDATGRYVVDAAWSNAFTNSMPWGGAMVTPSAFSISSDAWGNLYAADGMWSGQRGTVAKYRPTLDANGKTFVTRFGMFEDSWNAEALFQLAAVSVSRDGRYVYTAEVHNQRVQRWVWQPNETYRVDKIFGNSPLNPSPRQGWCGILDRLAGPYAIDVDPWGYVYVASTTCMQIQKFTPDGTAVHLNNVGNAAIHRTHYMAIDGHGNYYLSETKLKAVRTTPEPGPWPAITQPAADLQAPTLRQVTLPANTTTARVTVNIDALDNTAVTHVQFANDWDGVWGAWRPFTPAIQHDLYNGYGTRGVSVRVRDAAGNESNVLYRTTLYQRAADPAPDPDPAPNPDPAPDPGVDGAPIVGGVTVPPMSPTSEITVTIDATDDKGVTGMRLANDDGIWQAWKPFAARTQHTLRAGYGVRGVFVQVRDARGQESNVVYKTLKVEADAPAPGPDPGPAPGPAPAPDLNPPTLNEATVPNPTATQAVQIAVAANDDRGVAGIRFANEDGNWQAWKAYAAQPQHVLSPGKGLKAVFVQVRDAAGNESNVLLRRTLCDPCTAPAGFAAKRSLRKAKVHRGTAKADQVTSIGRRNEVFRFENRDRKRDSIDCGLGYDTAYVRREDRTVNCERVIRRR